MDQMTLLYVMTAFVIISAIALCIQAGMLAAMYKTAKSLQDAINPLLPKVDSLVTKTGATVEQSSKQITAITTRANEILDSTKRQLAIVEDLLGDASVRTKRELATVEEVVNDAASRAKMQLERADLLLDDTLSRAHQTVGMVHRGIMQPLRHVSGVAAGVQAAFSSISRGNRPTVDRVTSDEEMFI